MCVCVKGELILNYLCIHTLSELKEISGPQRSVTLSSLWKYRNESCVFTFGFII